MSYYRVVLNLGYNPLTNFPYQYEVEQGDAPDYGPIDGLEIAWSFTEGEARPQQPTPVTARTGVIVENADEFNVDIGDEMSIVVFTDPVGTTPPAPLSYPPPLATFAGRITDLDPEPHDLGTIYRISAVSYLADLIGTQGKEFGWGPEVPNQQNPPGNQDNYSLNYSLRDFVVTLWARNGLPNPFPYYPTFPPNDWATWPLQTLGNGLTGGLDSMMVHTRRALLSYLNQGTADSAGTSGLAGVVVEQVDYDTTDWTATPSTIPHAVQFIPRERRTNILGALPPADLGNAPFAQLTIDDIDVPNDFDAAWPYPVLPAHFGIIEAGMVEFDSVRWRRSKGQAVDTSEIGWRGPGDGAGNGGESHTYRQANNVAPVPIVRSLGDLHVYQGAQVRALATFYVPEYGEGSTRFQAETFRIRPGLGDPWVMSCAGYRNLLQPYSALLNPVVTIRDIPAKWNPNSQTPTFYAGSLIGARLGIENGDYFVDITLDSVVPRPSADPAATMDTFLSYLSYRNRASDATYAQTDDAITYEAARLLRRR